MPLGSRRGSTVFSRFPGIVLLLLAQGLAGCGDSGSSSMPSTPSEPSAQSTPTPIPTPTPTLTVFTDSATGFSTTDLRDSQEQILQLTTGGELVWTADGTRLPGYRVTHPTADGKVLFVEGKICLEQCAFEVRFGTRDGERRAYLTVDHIHWNPGTLVDVEVVGGALVVTETDVYPPGTPHAVGRGQRNDAEGTGAGRRGRGVAFGWLWLAIRDDRREWTLPDAGALRRHRQSRHQ